MSIKIALNLFVIVHFFGCYQKNNLSQDYCEVIRIAFDEFQSEHKDALKYFISERSYLTNISGGQGDRDKDMQSKYNFKTTLEIQFSNDQLLDIGQTCLQLPNVKSLNAKAALDSLNNKNNVENSIWSLSSFKKNGEKYYFILGCNFLADAYYIQKKNGIYVIEFIEHMSQ